MEDYARWAGLIIAAAGAFLANPDATAKVLRGFSGSARGRARQLRGFLARLIPALRKNGTINPIAATVATVSETFASPRTTVRGWAPNDTPDQKIAVLDERTRGLDKELGELTQKVSQTETQLRAELADTARVMRCEARGIQRNVDALKQDIDDSDASALPIVVIGILLAGFAPDLARAPNWVGWAVVVAALGLAAGFAWKIVRPRLAGTPSKSDRAGTLPVDETDL